MTDTPLSTLAAGYSAALAWWRGAGVDCAYADEPRGWLTSPEVAAEPERAPPPRTAAAKGARPALDRALTREPEAAIGGDPALWPADLAAFREFWLTEPSLDGGPVSARVPPRGPAGAALMVLVPQPEHADAERLLSGEEGQLLSRILSAIDIAEDAAYLASALPRLDPLPPWDALARRGLKDFTQHHIRLVGPQRLVIFGKAPAMLADGCGVPTLVGPQLETMIRSPAFKRRFWDALQGWLV